jgi:Kef-type K+ transport system membrane component KefB
VVLLVGQGFFVGLIMIAVALATVALVLLAALRYGKAISRVVSHESDEVVLLSTFGLVLLVAGVAQRFQVSAAVGAFLVGVAVSGPIVARRLKDTPSTPAPPGPATPPATPVPEGPPTEKAEERPG